LFAASDVVKETTGTAGTPRRWLVTRLEAVTPARTLAFRLGTYLRVCTEIGVRAMVHVSSMAGPYHAAFVDRQVAGCRRTV